MLSLKFIQKKPSSPKKRRKLILPRYHSVCLNKLSKPPYKHIHQYATPITGRSVLAYLREISRFCRLFIGELRYLWPLSRTARQLSEAPTATTLPNRYIFYIVIIIVKYLYIVKRFFTVLLFFIFRGL